MTRESESRLLTFCAAQRAAFRVADWIAYPHPSRGELVAAALFLAGVDWYGHRAALLQAAETLAPGCSGNLSALVRATGFDCSRFSNMLRRMLPHAQSAS